MQATSLSKAILTSSFVHRLRNFMCHEHLTVNLNPQINFIIGHNGSEWGSALFSANTLAHCG